ncbi:MAG: aspartate/glutamate racemase family protein, partial [Pseudomonadota bacterium]
RLVAAGAEAVAITSIGGHFCIEEFRPLSPLPIIDFISEMDRYLGQQTFSKVGLLGTDTVMETRFYGGIRSVEVLVPPSDVIARVHRAYVGMALDARVTDEQRSVVFEAGRALSEQGAEIVLLGGTDLFLAFDGREPGFATLDCATVHIDAIARMASK